MDLLEVTLAFSPINRRRLFRFLFGMRMMVPRQHCRNVSRCSTFGGEGTGLHANYDFNWTAGVTYAGLVHSSPLGNGYTDISGYFKHENGEWTIWLLIVARTNSPYLTGCIHLWRIGLWVRNAEKKVQELTVADVTHTKLVASDRYGTGVEGTSFYLFIDGPDNDIPSNTTIVRKSTGAIPDFGMKGSKNTSKSSRNAHSKSKTIAKHKKAKKTARRVHKKSKPMTTEHKN